MSAIYQRARPIRWDQVVGQEHVKDVLKAALEQGRVGHAYLFSGPRGVGKTTTARLIAMTANCTTPGIKPCGECESCLSVRAGNHPDVLEIDAASNNSVDDVRELREKVGLSAMRGGKKIYILDEAHMMSRAAFNALLKTLEEPPSHVIFILATTEPEKIIPTILSRCQHYRFRRLTPQEVAGKLAGIAATEGVQAEPEALNLIGRLADGAMRDGESLLERMLAAGQDVTRAGVEAALGLPPGEQMRNMAGALVQNDAATLLEGAASLYRAGYAARTVVEGLVTALGEALHAELGLHDTAAAQLEGADVPRLLRLQAALDAQDSRFARGADQQSLELALTHALLAGESGGSAQPSASAPSADVGQRLARLEKELRDLKASGVPMQAVSAPSRPAIQDEIPALDSAGRAPARAAAPVAVAPPAGGGTWADVVKLASSQLKAFMKPARMHAQQGYASLTYDDKGSFHAKQVISKFDDLGQLVVRVFGPVMLEIIGPTPDSSRKMQVGGRSVAEAGAAPVSPAPAAVHQVQPRSAATPAPPALDDIPPFGEARAQRAAPTPAAQPQTRADQIPEFTPSRSPAGSSGRASSAPPKRAVSLDDRAAAPLPEVAQHAPSHVADAPPLPDGAGLPASEPLPRDPGRATYLAPEPIFQEPDWDDLGGMPERHAGGRANAAAQPSGSACPPGARQNASRQNVAAGFECSVTARCCSALGGWTR
ncbi:DNA polymerase III subunit gamma/tau [Deinococcus sp. KNUC1210]|uniref:DNA polymerase III subunit gamma/tau n=1 Tax=Deinococcus sp. KNUC1210 TaxID=2917691 RepID=UPI001EF1591A|nr:DNA polymerase III subunit gamma/tau [Deinococcus sp. KNUC1210]ULH14588.1 DNA polymerase III subunit gamma/tau [Deinococcus sp. KNUC1210]